MKFGLDTPKKSPSLNSSSKVSGPSSVSNTWLWVFAVIVIIIIVSFGCWTTTDSFTNFKSKFGKTETLKDIDVVMFIVPTDKNCTKMMEVLKSENKTGDLKIIDITTDSGKKTAKEFGVLERGRVPCFVSMKYQTGWEGALPSTAELVKELSKKVEETPDTYGKRGGKETTQPTDDLDIIMFFRDGCGHCVNAKTQLGSSGLLDSITQFDITTEEGQQKAQELGLEIKGVPYFHSMKTGKNSSGFKSVDTIFEELK